MAGEGLVVEVQRDAPEVEGRGDPEDAPPGGALLLRGLVERGAGLGAPLLQRDGVPAAVAVGQAHPQAHLRLLGPPPQRPRQDAPLQLHLGHTTLTDTNTHAHTLTDTTTQQTHTHTHNRSLTQTHTITDTATPQTHTHTH